MKLLLLLAGLASSQETAQFLRIQPAPRPMAMAEAYTAVADDLWSMGVNPAGLARMSGQHAGFVHAELFDGMRYDYLAYGHATRHGTFGVSGSYLSHGELEGRDASGRASGSFDARDTMVGFSFARALPAAGLKGGATVKYLESTLADRSGRSVAVDLGLQRGASLGGVPLSFGAAVLNLGQAPKLGDTREDLPVAFSVGGAARLAGLALVSVDVRHRPNAVSSRTSFSVGTEYAVLPAVSLRAGYAPAVSDAAAAGPLKGLGMGLGVKFRGFGLDYSFTPAGELGTAQRIGLTTRW